MFSNKHIESICFYFVNKTYRMYMFENPCTCFKKHIDSICFKKTYRCLKKHIEFTCLGKTYAWMSKKHIDSIVFYPHVYVPSSPVYLGRIELLQTMGQKHTSFSCIGRRLSFRKSSTCS